MLKKTITILTFVFVLFILSKVSTAQTLTFCEGVDDKGRPETPSSTFYIPSGGGYFYFLVRMGSAGEIGCSSVSYLIYDVDYNYNETYNTTIYQDEVGRNWTWFWKKVTFYETGYYHVYVKDCYGVYIADSFVTIKWK